MISYLSGEVISRLAHGVILDVQGVGYEIYLTLPAIAELKEGKTSFWIHTRVREDALTLYGFKSWEERQAFLLLQQVNGVGPKVAMAVLSRLSVAGLRDAVIGHHREQLCLIPGIGRQTADKILVELQNKVEKLILAAAEERPQSAGLFATGAIPTQLREDLCSALENLGFRSKDVQKTVQSLVASYNGESFADLVKVALPLLSPASSNTASSTEMLSAF